MEPDTVKTPKINKSTFTLGSGAIEKRVANNERKITVLKNIFKAQKVEIGDKITPKVNVLEESLVSTNIILTDIAGQLQKDFKSRLAYQKSILDQERKNKLGKRRDDEEERLESRKKVNSFIKSTADKVVKPFSSVFDKLVNLGGILLTGIAANTAFQWLQDPKNLKKITDIFDFVKENPFLSLGIGALGIGATLVLGRRLLKLVKFLDPFYLFNRFVRGKGAKVVKPNPKITTSGGKAVKENIFSRMLRAMTPGKNLKGEVAEQAGKQLVKRGVGGKLLSRVIGSIGGDFLFGVGGIVVDLIAAVARFKAGDTFGGLLSLASAIPGPIGWVFTAIDIARELGFAKNVPIFGIERYYKYGKKNKKMMAGGIGKEGEDYNVHKGELFTTDGAYKADFSGKFIPNYEKTLAKSKNNFNIQVFKTTEDRRKKKVIDKTNEIPATSFIAIDPINSFNAYMTETPKVLGFDNMVYT